MATPLLLMVTDQTPTTHNGSHETKPGPTSNRGRKPGKGSSKKKQPQRGMGVAQLESLRLQERWKKMSQIPDPVQYQPSTLPDPIGGVPVQYGAGNYTRPMISGSGLVGLDPGLVIQRMGNGGFGGFGGGCGSGQVMVDMNWIGGQDLSGTITSVLGTSKELSSIPKMQQQCLSDHCDVCFKKRSDGVNMGFKGGSDKYKAIPPINSCDFLGLNLENKQFFNGEINGFGARVPKNASYAGHNLNEGVEVMAIHRKGNSVGGSILMEYEFFPRKSGGSTSSEELIKFPTEASVAVGGEASYITTTPYSANASNSVDLSLKLSY